MRQKELGTKFVKHSNLERLFILYSVSCDTTMKKIWDWEQEDLQNFIGEPENLRLEFKGSKIFEGTEDSISKSLSKQLSAFANTEGGILIIGIEERNEGRSKIADKIDSGVDYSKYSCERLQRILESNLSPFLTGIRIKPIIIDREKTRCAYVIDVPPGNTAYQAKDKLYYGRSEYECKALPDHEIRLRMFRGKYPNAIIDIDNCNIQIHKKSEPYDGRNKPSSHAFIIESNEDLNYKFSFQVLLRNIGEINIEEFKVQIKYDFSENLCLNLDILDETFKNGEMPRISKFQAKYSDMQITPQQVNVYPSDIYLIKNNLFYMHDKYFSDESSLILKWKLYLKNTQPLEGEINLVQKFIESIHESENQSINL